MSARFFVLVAAAVLSACEQRVEAKIERVHASLEDVFVAATAAIA